MLTQDLIKLQVNICHKLADLYKPLWHENLTSQEVITEKPCLTGQSTFLERLPDKKLYRNIDITCPASKRHERQQAKHAYMHFLSKHSKLAHTCDSMSDFLWGFISSFEYRHERSRTLTCYTLPWWPAVAWAATLV